MSFEHNQLFDCFISYASEDVGYAEITYERLSQGGFNVWFDKVCLLPGDDYRQKIVDGCRDGKIILLPIFTTHWGQRDWTKYETFGAKMIIPIIAAGCNNEVIPDPIRNLQTFAIDFQEPAKSDWLTLFRAIRLQQQGFRRCLGLERRPNNLRLVSIKDLFKGRAAMLAILHQHLLETPPGDTSISIQPHVIYGLGGVGKSRLAVEFAWRNESSFSGLLFVNAASPASFKKDLADLTRPTVLDLGLSDDEKEEVKIAATLRWLDEHPGWLLIIDNVDDGSGVKEVKNMLPRLTKGRVLITSRLADWANIVEIELPPLDLEQLSEEDAAAFLLARTESNRIASGEDEEIARSLARELGCLALALEQAGAYISKKRLRLADYRRRLNEKTQAILVWHDDLLMTYEKSVALTWLTSFQQLSSDGQSLLYMLSWLAPEPIPISLLEGDSTLADDRLDALVDLESFSFAKRSTDGRWISVHRLVQEITMRREQAKYSAETATPPTGFSSVLQALDTAAPLDPRESRSLQIWGDLQPHVMAVIVHAEAYGPKNPTNRLMRDLGTFLYAKALYTEAEKPLKKALSLDISQYGETHPLIARDLVALSRIYRFMERLPESEELCKKALAIDENQSEIDSSAIARDLIELGEALYLAKRLPEREPIYRRALDLNKRHYGDIHPAVAENLNNLGSALQDLQQYQEAEEVYRQSIQIGEQVLAPNDRDLAIWHNNLATLLGETERVSEAEEEYRKAIAIFEAGIVPDHPHLASALSSLAMRLIDTGRTEEAESFLIRALEIDDHRLGPDHSATLQNVSNLAALFIQLGKFREAKPFIWRLLESVEQKNGSKSKETQEVLLTYLGVIRQPGVFEVNKEDGQRLLELMERVFGVEEAWMYEFVFILAQLYEQGGKYEAARDLYLTTLEGYERLLGKDNSQTINVMNNLAMILEKMGIWNDAEEIFKQALERKSDDIVVLGNYAFLLQNGHLDFSRAKENYLKALEILPGDSINHTNYASLCLIMNNQEESEVHLNEAWKLIGKNVDGFAFRILFLRAVLSALKKEDMNRYLGQLKTLFDTGIQPAWWRNISLREYIGKSLRPDQAKLLEAIYEAFNGKDGLQRLKNMVAWQSVSPLPIELV